MVSPTKATTMTTPSGRDFIFYVVYFIPLDQEEAGLELKP